MNPTLSIYDATTPAELRAAVLELCAAAIGVGRCGDPPQRKRHLAEVIVPPLPPVWRVITLSDHSYRCANGVVEYLALDGKWCESVWLHTQHATAVADLIAHPCEEVSA
jgi:hypothetical protein